VKGKQFDIRRISRSHETAEPKFEHVAAHRLCLLAGADGNADITIDTECHDGTWCIGMERVNRVQRSASQTVVHGKDPYRVLFWQWCGEVK
jgi:hypothetical protein